MPLQPNGGKFLMPVESEADVCAFFEKALELSQTVSPRLWERYRSDIEDHFYYVGAICPQYFRPLRDEVVRLFAAQLSMLRFSFVTWLYLLQDAPDSCVEQVLRRLMLREQDCSSDMLELELMLAAICTPAALAAIAEYAARVDRASSFRSLGFWLPGHGKSAEPRFMQQRYALRFQSVGADISEQELALRPHPVGLPISFIAEESAQSQIAWHYLTLDLTRIEGLPATMFTRIHLVSPPYDSGWTLFNTISERNLYTQTRLDLSADEDDPEWVERLRQQASEYQGYGRGEALLLPYDDRLVYRNGHTQMTDGVHGDVGGPSLGLTEHPSCPNCGKLMFHVCTVASTLREYGDGFRSLFFCEECRQVVSQSAGWN